MPGGVTLIVPKLWYTLAEIQPSFTPQLNLAKFPPSALKFTFRLYDSRGIIEGGREFTHIIYLED